VVDLATLITALAAWKWPAVVALGLLLFRRDVSAAIARLRKGKLPQFEFELDKLEEKAATAAAESRELPPGPETKALPPASEPSTISREVLLQAVQSPKTALMLLAINIERELRELLAATGWHRMQRYTSLPAGIERLAAETPLPESLKEAVQQFWPIRNRLVHGHAVEEDEILRAIDAGLLILTSIRAIPHEVNVVYHPGADVFEDAKGERRADGVRALILETTSPDRAAKTLRVYPTTRTDYVKGKRVAWEWTSRNRYGESWYRDPDSGELKYGWTSSLEFVGRHLDEL
jgi:hypothetical protein